MKTAVADECAEELPQAGNWRRFEHFEWHRRPADAERWTLCHTRHRDSGLSAQSNAAQIEEALARFDDDVSFRFFDFSNVDVLDTLKVTVFGKVHTEPAAKATA